MTKIFKYICQPLKKDHAILKPNITLTEVELCYDMILAEMYEGFGTMHINAAKYNEIYENRKENISWYCLTL